MIIDNRFRFGRYWKMSENETLIDEISIIRLPRFQHIIIVPAFVPRRKTATCLIVPNLALLWSPINSLLQRLLGLH